MKRVSLIKVLLTAIAASIASGYVDSLFKPWLSLPVLAEHAAILAGILSVVLYLQSWLLLKRKAQP